MMVETLVEVGSFVWIMLGGCVLGVILLFIDSEREDDDPFRCTSGTHTYVDFDVVNRVCTKCGLVWHREWSDAGGKYLWHRRGYTDDPEALIKRWREAENRERLQKQKQREDYVKRIKNTKIN